MKNSDEPLKTDSRDSDKPLPQNWVDWPTIARELRIAAAGPLAHQQQAVVAVECSNRINTAALLADLRTGLSDAVVLDCRQTFKIQTLIDTLTAPWLEPHSPATPCPLDMKQFLDADRMEAFAKSLAEHSGLVVVAGPGASCCCQPDVLAYADNALETEENDSHPSDYAFSTSSPAIAFPHRMQRRRLIDTPVARRLADKTRPRWNYFLNVNHTNGPVMVATGDLWTALKLLARRPFAWQPDIHPKAWKIGHWSCQPTPYGRVNVVTASGVMPMTTDHLFSQEGPSLLGQREAAMRHFTGLCPSEILMRMATENAMGGLWNKESQMMPDFIAREQLALDDAVQFHTTNGSMHILFGTDDPVNLEYWATVPQKYSDRPPDGKQAIRNGEAIIIPASVEFFRLIPESRQTSHGGPILYRWALGATDSH